MSSSRAPGSRTQTQASFKIASMPEGDATIPLQFEAAQARCRLLGKGNPQFASRWNKPNSRHYEQNF
jgi:hypothetical protein